MSGCRTNKYQQFNFIKMKTLFITTLLFSLMSFQIGTSNNAIEAESKLTATYLGMNNDGTYQYKDASNNTHTFGELGDEVDYDLLEDEYIGKKFNISWVEVDSDVYDDDGDETGETVKVKQIVSLSLVK